MRPKQEPEQPWRELFQIDLEQLIDMNHPLVGLGLCIDWSSFERTLSNTYHPSQGAPGVTTRLMVALHYQKYQHGLSDEDMVAVWVENSYWQHFSGVGYFQYRMPIDPSSMTRWRKRLGEAGAEQMLQVTIDKDKIYSVHEPEVHCIAKGKAGKQYEFGNKVSVAVSSRGGWFVGTKSFTGDPYDGHTLAAQIEQVKNLIGNKVSEVHVDMGYRGHDYDGAVAVHVDKRRRGRTPRALWRWMKRRAAVEPSIGHLKNEHRLERNRLKGVAGNAINAVLAAAAMNFHKLLGAFGRIFLRRLLDIHIRSGLQFLRSHETSQTQYQYA
ncbi:MAG TPA: transposase [Terracidiphilus sp.]|nr:transposase [Terracidiphilus sp.]